jgi:hypothetical protein
LGLAQMTWGCCALRLAARQAHRRPCAPSRTRASFFHIAHLSTNRFVFFSYDIRTFTPTPPRTLPQLSPTRRLQRHMVTNTLSPGTLSRPSSSADLQRSVSEPKFRFSHGTAYSRCLPPVTLLTTRVTGTPTPYAAQMQARGAHTCFCSHGPAVTFGHRLHGRPVEGPAPGAYSPRLPTGGPSWTMPVRTTQRER